MKSQRSLDSLLALVFVAFALLCGSALVHEAAQQFADPHATPAQA